MHLCKTLSRVIYGNIAMHYGQDLVIWADALTYVLSTSVDVYRYCRKEFVLIEEVMPLERDI